MLGYHSVNARARYQKTKSVRREYIEGEPRMMMTKCVVVKNVIVECVSTPLEYNK